MDQEALVEARIEDSIEFVKELDKYEHKLTKAIWYYYDDVETWRLILAGPSLNKLLPKQEPLAYKFIAEAMNNKKLTSLSISEIKLMRTDDPLISTLSFLIGTDAEGVIRASFNDTTINGVFIKSMLVLRSA